MSVESGSQQLGRAFLMCDPFDEYCKHIVIMKMDNTNTILTRIKQGDIKLEVSLSVGHVIYESKFKEDSYDMVGKHPHS